MSRYLLALLSTAACRRGELVEPHRTWRGAEALDNAGRALDLGQADDDSLAELLIGTPNLTSEVDPGTSGGAYVVDAGTRSGVLDDVTVGHVVDQPTGPGELGDMVDENLGFDVALVGDVSGDGVGDIAVSGVNEALTGDIVQHVGYSHILQDPITSPVSAVDAWVIVHAGGSDTEPAWTTDCGDVNGDENDDLCIGTNGAVNEDFSEAAVLFGPLTGGLLDYETSKSVVLVADPTEWAGQTLEGGVDITGDGLDDLVVGANKRDAENGGVYLVSDPGPGTVDLAGFPLWTGEPGAGHAGEGLAVGGDLDGDGAEDFYVGAHLLEDQQGRGYVVTDPTGGPLAEAFARFDGARKVDWAGFDAALGDLDGDAASDLALGIPRIFYSGAPEPGRVAIWLGPIRRGAHDEQDADLVLRGSKRPDAFGFALDAGDVDGDGVDDLVVGAPIDSEIAESSGAVHLFLGGTLPL